MINSNIHTAQIDIKVITIYGHVIVYLTKVVRTNLQLHGLMFK